MIPYLITNGSSGNYHCFDHQSCTFKDMRRIKLLWKYWLCWNVCCDHSVNIPSWFFNLNTANYGCNYWPNNYSYHSHCSPGHLPSVHLFLNINTFCSNIKFVFQYYTLFKRDSVTIYPPPGLKSTKCFCVRWYSQSQGLKMFVLPSCLLVTSVGKLTKFLKIQQIMWCKTWGFHICSAEDSSLQTCYAMSLGKQLPKFWTILVPSS